MSIDVAAYVNELPANWKNQVCAEMRHLGLNVELHPLFDPFDPAQDCIWVKVLDFDSRTRLHPNAALLVGCGMSYESSTTVLRWASYPAEAHDKMHLFGLHSSTGRSGLAVALQITFAAALAIVADGVFHEQVNDTIYLPDDDLQHWVQNQTQNLTDSGAMIFTEWPPIDPDEAVTWSFPPEIHDTSPQKLPAMNHPSQTESQPGPSGMLKRLSSLFKLSR